MPEGPDEPDRPDAPVAPPAKETTANTATSTAMPTAEPAAESPRATDRGRDPNPGEGRPAYDDAPPFWVDAEEEPPQSGGDRTSERGSQPGGPTSDRAGHTASSGTGSANPLALIEEVFPGKVMGFTPASTPAPDGAADSEAPLGADPESFPEDPDDGEDADD